MKKRMLLPLIFLLTFALWLTPTPAADEWVLHKTITKPGSAVTAVAFSPKWQSIDCWHLVQRYRVQCPGLRWKHL